ncbi:MAG: transcription-repair coupling factor, partial [Flavobacteriaceae bacterium]|nr:transcription-repair coupling factor [Flavobacteriaceae bacterium]
MSKTALSQTFSQTLQIQDLQTAVSSENARVRLKGLVGSSLSFVIAEAFKCCEKPFLVIFNDKEEAAFYLNDLEHLLGDKHVLFYPGSYRRPYQIEETDNANVLLRAEVLNRINSRKKPALIVTYPDALFEKVVTRKELERNTLKISIGDKLSLDFVNETLFEYKFKRVDFVSEPGEFSVRGGILDVFSFSNEEPYRLEFFGDEIDSIRTFDVETQLSIESVKKINIIPNVANKQLVESRQSFLNYIRGKTVIFTKEQDILFNRIDGLYEKAVEAYTTLNTEIKYSSPQDIFCNSETIKNEMLEHTLVELGSTTLNGESEIQQ